MPNQSPVSSIRNTTQQHLDIEEITEDIVILKDGSGCLIIQASAINFSLLSEDEQEATIYAYAAILNSLTYPIQIIINSERKDISDYLRYIKLQEDQQQNKILREHLRRYRRFVEETVQKNNVLDKKFYIIIPFTSLELGAPKAMFNQISGSNKLPFSLSYILEKAKNHLIPKRDHLSRQFSRLGIRLRQLETSELIEIFYKAYNPDLSRGIKLDNSQSYTAPIVQSSSPLGPQIVSYVNQINQNPPTQTAESPSTVASPPQTSNEPKSQPTSSEIQTSDQSMHPQSNPSQTPLDSNPTPAQNLNPNPISQ